MDVYYNWNFNQSSPEALRNFDITHNSFSLNYAEVAVAKAPTELSRAGFRMDFGAGDTANLVNAFEPGGTDFLKYVQQAYVSFLAPAGKGLTIDFGKFVTPAGAEVIESKDNFNYSRGLLFALAIPYYHAGARVGYSFNDKVSLTGYLVNGWNDVKDNNKVLWTNPSLVFRDEYDVNSNVAGVDASAFFRQDANALDRLSKNFARNVVTSILEAF